TSFRVTLEPPGLPRSRTGRGGPGAPQGPFPPSLNRSERVPLPCPRALTAEPSPKPGLTLSRPEGLHRTVQEEAPPRARGAGARLGQVRARTRPGSTAGARSGSRSGALPAPPAPARAGHVVPPLPARLGPGGPSASAGARPRPRQRSKWGEGRRTRGARVGKAEGNLRTGKKTVLTCESKCKTNLSAPRPAFLGSISFIYR
ncbi:PREDICTED: uncharacterized protein LOC109376422, partial [Hipposideros armiger]|uniref:Uncharacterized protein LOC109376422 n=1 Tax=Hipposideros armiger TaxID=186990 RepID=A0A8B7QJN0_HIPAR